MGRGQRGGRGAWGSGPGMMGRGVMGTVTEVASGHYTIKTESGEIYTVHFSANTRIMKGGGGIRRGGQDEGGPPPNPPEAIKATDIKVVLYAVPGALLGMALVYAEGIRRERLTAAA